MELGAVAKLQALGRIAVGTLLALVPERAGAGWIGDAAEDPRTAVLARALGARDAAMGAGVLLSLRDRKAARPWLAGCLVADAVDCAASLAARDALPPVARVGAPLVAGGSVVLGAVLIGGLR